jgi:hypothetical protein
MTIGSIWFNDYLKGLDYNLKMTERYANNEDNFEEDSL